MILNHTLNYPVVYISILKYYTDLKERQNQID